MKILEIQLLANDLEKAERFYHHLLGLKLLHKSENKIAFQVGTSRLVFLKSAEKNPFYHFTFHIPHNQLLEAMEWVGAKIDILETEEGDKIVDFDNWNAKSFYFFDEEGNILECIARFDLANASKRTFDTDSLLGLSELAVVSEDVLLFAEKIKLEYQLPLFVRQVQRENFHAFGDDEGLFLISKQGRNWYPTQIAGKCFYAKGIFLLEEKEIEIEINTASRPISLD